MRHRTRLPAAAVTTSARIRAALTGTLAALVAGTLLHAPPASAAPPAAPAAITAFLAGSTGVWNMSPPTRLPAPAVPPPPRTRAALTGPPPARAAAPPPPPPPARAPPPAAPRLLAAEGTSVEIPPLV